MPRRSHKTDTFTESVIRDMSRLAAAAGAINLAQGFPDFPAPAELKAAAAAVYRSLFAERPVEEPETLADVVVAASVTRRGR